MNYFERIPAKTEAVSLTGANVKIDTEGMEAVIVCREGTAYIKALGNVKDTDAFALEKGHSISLNGSFYLGGDNADVRILYCRII